MQELKISYQADLVWGISKMALKLDILCKVISLLFSSNVKVSKIFCCEYIARK